MTRIKKMAYRTYVTWECKDKIDLIYWFVNNKRKKKKNSKIVVYTVTLTDAYV